MNPLLTGFMGGGLSQDARSGVGPSTIGQNNSFTSYSPFAVGDGATATSSGTAKPPIDWTMIGLIAAGAFVASRLLR